MELIFLPSHAFQTFSLVPYSLFEAGDGNRTHNNSLEGCGFTTKLHPQIAAIFKSQRNNIANYNILPITCKLPFIRFELFKSL
jgi:hypothetical protein